MVCTDATIVAEIPVLKGCRSYEGLKGAAEDAANEVVDNWIAGRRSPILEENPKAAGILQQAYDLGKKLPPSSSCLIGTIDDECTSLMGEAGHQQTSGATPNSR